MRALRVVVLDVGAEDSLEMAAVEDQEPVEALGTDGADEALGDGIRFGRSDWRAEDPDSLAAEDLVEGAGVLAVTVAIRKRIRCSAKKRPRLRACWVTQLPSGLAVQPPRWTRRLPCSMTNKT
jgi:hypothetical protein